MRASEEMGNNDPCEQRQIPKDTYGGEETIQLAGHTRTSECGENTHDKQEIQRHQPNAYQDGDVPVTPPHDASSFSASTASAAASQTA